MKYIGKKVLSSIVTLLIVSFLDFFAFGIIPGDPATAKLGTQATPEKVSALREEMGLNRPLIERYFEWLTGVVRGDFGESYSYNIPVTEMIKDKLPVTIFLTFFSFIIMLVISQVVGIYTARKEGKFIDKAILIVNQIIMSIPPFFSGILITLFFGIVFRVFTPGGYVSYQTNFGGFIAYLFFPALAIALPKSAMTIKLLRSSLLEEKKKDYVRTAYSRGNSTKEIFYHHILKNACIPVITFLGMTLADMIAGSIIIEQVFNIPGLGRILLTSIQNRDYPVVEAIIICIAFLVIVINLLVDFIYRKVDPRITLE